MPVIEDLLRAVGLVAPAVLPRVRLEFPLRTFDQARVNAGFAIGPGPVEWPDRMQLDFTVGDPAAGAPEVFPLFPGKLFFHADPPGALPDPAVAAFDWDDYDNWPVEGRIRVDLDVTALENRLRALGAAFPVVPTRVWYWPVVLPKEMLTEASLKGFTPRTAVRRPAGAPIGTGAARWAQHALVGFLAGRHPLPLVQHPTDPINDTVQQQHLPRVQMDDASGAVSLTMALARPVTLDDAASAEVTAAAGAATPEDPDHPLNAPVPVRRVLQAAKAELDTSEAMAAAATAGWPAGPRWFDLRLATPGRPATPPYMLGALASQTVEIAAGANILHSRSLPVHGAVSIAQQSADPPPAAPTVTVTPTAGPLAVVETNVADPADSARLLVDLGANPAGGWAALMPAVPAAKPALVKRCAAITQSARTKKAVQDHLLDYARRIRPAAWNGNVADGVLFDEIFHGGRRPWTTLRESDFKRLFDAMDLVTFADPLNPVTVRRPSFAVLLWLMEGLMDQKTFNLTSTAFRTLGDIGAAGLVTWPLADRKLATPAQIRTAVRVILFWGFFGIDINNWNRHKGPDNQPSLGDRPLAETIAGHNGLRAGEGGYAQADQDVRDAGILPPTAAQVHAEISVRQNPAGSGNWEFKLSPNAVPTLLACQYAEYLRRLIQLPGGARDYASFAYTAYNGNPVTAGNLFSDADAEIAADPATWAGKDHEDVLMSKKLAGTEVVRGSPPVGGRLTRSIHPKVQTLHVAALADSWAYHLPNTWG